MQSPLILCNRGIDSLCGLPYSCLNTAQSKPGRVWGDSMIPRRPWYSAR